MKDFEPKSAIKQGNRYKSLSNKDIIILDQMQYCPVGTSLDKYLKSRKTDFIKGHFPYRWLTSYNKLSDTQLPSYKFFENTKTTTEEYEKLNIIWKQENMTSMFDYLKYYNNLDVKPLIQAIEKHRSFYYNLGFDMHKDAISLSGLAEKIMFKNARDQKIDNVPSHKELIVKNDISEEIDVYDNKVYLIDEDNKECFYLLRKNNTGGPSIVFNRYHENDVTKITRVRRKGDKYILDKEGKLIKKIVGFDANALYLYSLMQGMPTSNLKHQIFNDNQNINELLKNTFGFYEVDIEVPKNDEMYDKFSEFPPLFKNCILNDKAKKIISVMSCEKILIYHPLLQWNINHGLIVTKVHSMIHCKKWKCFKSFGELVSAERRKGD